MEENTVAEVPASEPEISEAQPVSTEAPVAEETQTPEKTYTKAELSEIVKREALKAEAKAERRAVKAYQDTLERVLPRQQEQRSVADDRPTQAQFANVDDYVEAMTEWKLAQRERAASEEKAKTEHSKIMAKRDKIFGEASKDASFDREHFLTLPVSAVVAEAILESDVSSKICVYLNANPGEAERISGLPLARQAAEIGKIEVKVSATPTTSKAPAPINPIGGTGKATKNPADMTDAEYAKWRAEGRK